MPRFETITTEAAARQHYAFYPHARQAVVRTTQADIRGCDGGVRLELGPASLGWLVRAATAMERIASKPQPMDVRAHQSSGNSAKGSGDVAHPADQTAAFKGLEAAVSEIKTELADIKELLTAERGEIVKEAYKVPEVAKKTKLKEYTIRQACNKGRITRAYKGKDHQWRIPHAALVEIEKNGLPPE